MDLERAPFDLRGVHRGRRRPDRARARARRASSSPTRSSPGRARDRVGDAGRLRQILLNLLSNNAVKFTEAGEIVVIAGATASEKPSTIEYHLAVRDTGIGIPKDRMDRLFQSFSQVDASIARPVRRHRPRPRDQPAARRADGRHGQGREQRRPGRGQHVPPHVRRRGDRHDADGTPPRRLVRGASGARRRRQRDEPPDLMTALLGGWGIGRSARRLGTRRSRGLERGRAVRRRGPRHADAGMDGLELARARDPRARRRAADVLASSSVRRHDASGDPADGSRPPASATRGDEADQGRRRCTTRWRPCWGPAPRARATQASAAGVDRPARSATAPAADPAGRGQRREPEARDPAAREAGVSRRRRRPTGSRRSRRSSASRTTSC